MRDNLIYDVGMNNGDDSAYYLHKGFQVVAVEARPDLCAQAADRFRREVDSGRLTILNLGIHEGEGSVDFWVCETNSAWSSFDRAVASRNGAPHHAVRIPCADFGTVLAAHGVPYFLKIDIEGKDRTCLDALSPRDTPRHLSIEGSIDDAPEFPVLDQLEKLGYKAFKAVSQFMFLPIEVPYAPETMYHLRFGSLVGNRLPGRIVRKVVGERRLDRLLHPTRHEGDWRFPPGSSGPFGEQTPGRWQTVAELRGTLDHFAEQFRSGRPGPFWEAEPFSFWFDIHATSRA